MNKKKKIKIIIFLVIVCGLTVCIFLRNKPVKLEYTYTEKVNKINKAEWKIKFKIESPQLSKGFFENPLYKEVLDFTMKEGSVTCKLDSEFDYSKTNLNYDLNLYNEAYSVLFDSNLEMDYLEKKSLGYNKTDAIEKNGYVIALTTDSRVDSKQRRSDKAHKGIFFIYDKSSKEIIYLAEFELNENYCIARTCGLFVENISIAY